MTDNPLRNEDFEAIEAAVMETARGRWFLTEYARRQRLAEATGIIDAIKSLEERLTAPLAPPTASQAPDMAVISQLIDDAYDHVLTAFGVNKIRASDAAPSPSRAEAAKLAAETLRDLRGRMQALSGVPEAAYVVSKVYQEAAAELPADMPPVEQLDDAETAKAELPAVTVVQEDPIVEQDLFGDAPEPDAVVEEIVAPEPRRPDNHEHLATTLRAAIAQVRGPSSDIDALSFEAKSVLFA